MRTGAAVALATCSKWTLSGAEDPKGPRRCSVLELKGAKRPSIPRDNADSDFNFQSTLETLFFMKIRVL